MDNQQRRLQQIINLDGIDIDAIQLSNKFLHSTPIKYDFISDLHIIPREHMVIKYNLPNIGVYNNIVLKYYKYISTLSLPKEFCIATLYENKDYAINSDGYLFTIKTRKLVTPYLDEFGYLRVNVRHIKPHTSKRAIYERLHRLICMTFKPITNPSELEVNHIDGNKLNNSLENLEWVTKQENLSHAWDNNLRLLPSEYRKRTLSK